MPVAAAAQITDLRLPISLDADSTAYDGKNQMLMFRGLRMTQGTIGIAAEEGRASNLNFEDSVWQFAGDVVIDVENGHIECDTADLQFRNHQLTIATIAGSPATFELTRPGSEETTYAEAGKLRYDLLAGTVEFSGDAVITEGGNQIASDYLIYNIVEQRINAQGSPGDDGKVRITYTPKDEAGQQQDPDATEATDEPGPEDDGQ
jgi:lipopolysaccharide transport protein LptA